jgi:hypothetical protein
MRENEFLPPVSKSQNRKENRGDGKKAPGKNERACRTLSRVSAEKHRLMSEGFLTAAVP